MKIFLAIVAVLVLASASVACPPVAIQSAAVVQSYAYAPQAVAVQNVCPQVAVAQVQSYAQVQSVQAVQYQAVAVPAFVQLQAVAVKQVHVQAAPRARIFGSRSVAVQKTVVRSR
jgi:hypothetical protein